MDFSFNVEIAKRYGVDGAVLIHALYWWIRKNAANGRHYYEGRTWTYNSWAAFAKLFPFWSPKQIRRITTNLRNDGALLSMQRNDAGFDRTMWYALSDEILGIYGEDDMPKRVQCIGPNGPMDAPKRANDITVSKPVNNTPPIVPPKGENTKKFTPPTVDEVRAYCEERKNTVDPEAFVDFYESKGWLIGKAKMKDRRADVRTWERTDGRGQTKDDGLRFLP